MRLRRFNKLPLWKKILLFAAIGIFACVVFTVGILNAKEALERSNLHRSNDVALQASGGIEVSATITNIELSSYSFVIHYQFHPFGTLLDLSDPTNKTAKVDVTMTLDTRIVQFQQGQYMTPVDVRVTFQSGDSNSFPFDDYKSTFIVSASLSNATSKDNLPIALNVLGSLTSWNMSIPSVEDLSARQDGTLMAATIVVSRSLTTKVFSVFIAIIMWVLSLSVLGIALNVYIQHRKTEPPTMALATSMLFALPAVRNVQPGAPPIGCTSDVTSFFWAMVIVSIAATMLLVNYIFKYKKEKRKPGDVGPGPMTSLGRRLTRMVPTVKRTQRDRPAMVEP